MRFVRPSPGCQFKSVHVFCSWCLLSQGAHQVWHVARQDYEHIDNGHYSLPWDMVTRNRQWSPLYVAQRSAQVRC
jgi:hypothetical protein